MTFTSVSGNIETSGAVKSLPKNAELHQLVCKSTGGQVLSKRTIQKPEQQESIIPSG